MRLIHTARFEKDYSAVPTNVQRAFDKQEWGSDGPTRRS